MDHKKFALLQITRALGASQVVKGMDEKQTSSQLFSFVSLVFYFWGEREGVCSTNSLPSFLPTWGVLVYFLPCFLFCKWLKSSSRGSTAAVFQKDYWTKNLSNICFTSPTMQWWILSICRCLYFSFPFWWLCSKHWHLDTSILSLPPLKRGTKFPVPSRELSLPCTKLAMSSLLFSSLTWDLVDIFLFGLEWVSWSWPWLCGARLL